MNTKEHVWRKIVFPHIMKTAGTSLISWIQRHYYVDEILYSASVWLELRGKPRRELEAKRFVRGHFGSRILNVFGEHNGFTAIALVRDPVERIISHYWHLKNAPDQLNFEFARDPAFTFEAYLEHPETQYLISNYQVASYSGVIGEGSATAKAGASEEVSPLDMGRAKAFIDRCEVVGTTAALDRFVAALSGSFGFFPDPKLQRRRSYRQEYAYGDGVLARVRRLNEADYELYDYVRTRASAPTTTYAADRPKNPNSARANGNVLWRAGMPYWGRGWTDATGDEKERHLWSVDSVATIEFDVKQGDGYVLMFSIMRFVVAYQAECFRLLCNEREIVPTRISTTDEGPQFYAVSLGRAQSPRVTIGFKLSNLVSFREINDKDPDTEKRGLALSTVTLLAAGTGSQ